MNKWQLYRLLRKNTNISYKRSPILEQNKWAKALFFLLGGLFVSYLILYGILFAMGADGSAGSITSIMPFILALDFLLRFIFQTTPGMMVKPYILQPISRYAAIECFLLSEHISIYNLLWLSMFIPYSMVILIAGAGFGPTLTELITCELLIMLNSQVYLFFRTLINRNVLWMLAAIAFYALPFSPLVFSPGKRTFLAILDTISGFGGSWYAPLPVAVGLVGLFYVNRHFQFRFVYEEIAKSKERSLRHVSQFAFLDRFGLIGEYIKIELKSNMRNKTMRSRCLMSLALIVFFSLIVAYTSLYDNQLMENFWCLYCFAIYGMTALIKIMGQEGNYIDLLMMHRESIIPLLRAKFLFYSAVLIIPFLIMLPAVFNGKFTLLMLFAYMLFMAGFLHFIIFQLAVYNKQTLPLQERITAKGNFENGIQIVIETTALLLPIFIVSIGYITIGLDYTYIIMCIIGLAFIFTHPLWIRNIYRRMMQRRYDNLESFHSTRQ